MGLKGEVGERDVSQRDTPNNVFILYHPLVAVLILSFLAITSLMKNFTSRSIIGSLITLWPLIGRVAGRLVGRSVIIT